MPKRTQRTQAIVDLVNQIRPLLAGQPPNIVGGALADLTAIWIASHIAPGNPEKTREHRAGLLAFQMQAIECLIEPNAGLIHAEQKLKDDLGRFQ